jgi:ACS family tartrate transporter-like MFS transporter
VATRFANFVQSSSPGCAERSSLQPQRLRQFDPHVEAKKVRHQLKLVIEQKRAGLREAASRRGYLQQARIRRMHHRIANDRGRAQSRAVERKRIAFVHAHRRCVDNHFEAGCDWPADVRVVTLRDETRGQRICTRGIDVADRDARHAGFREGEGDRSADATAADHDGSLALHALPARRWLARIMITWGFVTMASAFIAGPTSFYVMRFLLGLAEAGFFPGILLYMTYWFPSDHRAKTTALFTMALPVSVVIGGPLASVRLSIGDIGGLAPWRWTFVIGGIPAVLLGILTWCTMSSKPAGASWLSDDEKHSLLDRLRAEEHPDDERHTRSLRAALQDRRVILLALVHFFWAIGLYSAALWLPQVVSKLGLSNGEVGWAMAVPALLGASAMYAWGVYSDRTKHRRRHAMIANLIGAAGLVGSALLTQPLLSMLAITVGMIGIYCYSAVFYPIPQAILRGPGAASGIAFVTAFSNLAGFVGTYMVGWLNLHFGNFTYALLALATSLLISTLLLVFVPHDVALETPRG